MTRDELLSSLHGTVQVTKWYDEANEEDIFDRIFPEDKKSRGEERCYWRRAIEDCGPMLAAILEPYISRGT